MYVKLWHTTGRPDYCIQYVLGLYTINSFVVIEGERKTFHDKKKNEFKASMYGH